MSEPRRPSGIVGTEGSCVAREITTIPVFLVGAALEAIIACAMYTICIQGSALPFHKAFLTLLKSNICVCNLVPRAH
jgi:hypothetical protein